MEMIRQDNQSGQLKWVLFPCSSQHLLKKINVLLFCKIIGPIVRDTNDEYGQIWNIITSVIHSWYYFFVGYSACGGKPDLQIVPFLSGKSPCRSGCRRLPDIIFDPCLSGSSPARGGVATRPTFLSKTSRISPGSLYKPTSSVLNISLPLIPFRFCLWSHPVSFQSFSADNLLIS
jgi:hypothetical protein